MGAMRRMTAVVTSFVLVLLPSTAAHAEPDDPRVEIVGGERAGPDEFPWMVKLSNGCAGTLIRARYVLTAAHCLRTGWRSITATVGSADLFSPKAEKIRADGAERASGFQSVTQGRDWAVLRLAREASLPVVRLPQDSGLDNGSFTAVGWGATSENSRGMERYLRKVQVPYVPDGTCERLYGSEGYGFVASDMLCAGDLEQGGKDSCQGDSGGPLLRRHDNGWVQVGIVSWGVGCGRSSFPGVYTQVSRFVDDINRAIEESAIEERGSPG